MEKSLDSPSKIVCSQVSLKAYAVRHHVEHNLWCRKGNLKFCSFCEFCNGSPVYGLEIEKLCQGEE